MDQLTSNQQVSVHFSFNRNVMSSADKNGKGRQPHKVMQGTSMLGSASKITTMTLFDVCV